MSLNISHIKTKLSFSPPGIRSPPCCFKLPSVQTRLINSFQNGWDIKELSLYATSSGSNVLLENLAWQIVTVCPRIQQRQQLCYERADRVKEYCREDRGAAGEGHGGLVKKPLLPDVHLNKELFPVAVNLFIFLTYSFFFPCQPAATLTGKKGFVPSMARETLLKMSDWISVNCPFFVAEFRA